MNRSKHPRVVTLAGVLIRLFLILICGPTPYCLCVALQNISNKVTSVDFSKDGDWIRSNCEGGQLHIWDSNKGKHQVWRGYTRMYRFPFAGQSLCLSCIDLNHFSGWWVFLFFSAVQNVIGFYRSSPHVRNNASEGLYDM